MQAAFPRDGGANVRRTGQANAVGTSGGMGRTCSPSPLTDAALAACRTGGDFYVPRILLRIERLSLLKIIATIADGRWRKVSRRRAAIQASIESAQPRLSACIRLMFQAMVTRLHSPRTQSSPRSRNGGIPSPI